MLRTTAPARRLLQKVVSHYLESPDFNGLELRLLLAGQAPVGLNLVKDLVRRGLIEVISGKWDNPYVRRMPPRKIEVQLQILNEREGLICVYPTVKHMRRVIPRKLYRDRHFSRLLALGHPQIEPVFFELGV